MGNTESSRPELVKPIRGGGSDCGDSYMGDIDMASNDDDCSRGSFSCPPSPGSGPVALVTLTSDEDDDVEMGIPSELEEEDRIAMERAKRRAALQMKVRHCQPCLVRTVEADLNLPLYQIETLWYVPFIENECLEIFPTQKIKETFIFLFIPVLQGLISPKTKGKMSSDDSTSLFH